MGETLAYYALIVLGLGALLWFGMARDRRTAEAIRRYAERHGLQFHPGNLLKGIKAAATGRYRGWKVSIGPVVIETYTKGIGPANRAVHLEARLELAEGVAADPAKLQGFLQQGGGISGRSLMLYFPKKDFSALTCEEIDQALARLVDAAQKTSDR